MLETRGSHFSSTHSCLDEAASLLCLVFGVANAVVVQKPAGAGQPESTMAAACALPSYKSFCGWEAGQLDGWLSGWLGQLSGQLPGLLSWPVAASCLSGRPHGLRVWLSV